MYLIVEENVVGMSRDFSLCSYTHIYTHTLRGYVGLPVTVCIRCHNKGYISISDIQLLQHGTQKNWILPKNLGITQGILDTTLNPKP